MKKTASQWLKRRAKIPPASKVSYIRFFKIFRRSLSLSAQDRKQTAEKGVLNGSFVYYVVRSANEREKKYFVEDEKYKFSAFDWFIVVVTVMWRRKNRCRTRRNFQLLSHWGILSPRLSGSTAFSASHLEVRIQQRRFTIIAIRFLCLFSSELKFEF